jgi:hypothetical protein
MKTAGWFAVVVLGLCATFGCGTAAPVDRGGAATGACAAPTTGFRLRERVPGVVGCPSDVRTHAGTYQGYLVDFGCLGRGDGEGLVVIRGLGGKTFRQSSAAVPSEDPEDESGFWRRLGDVVRQTANVPSVHAANRVHACQARGYAIELRMHSFREADDAISALGDWLARQGSGGEVLLVFEAKSDPSDAL